MEEVTDVAFREMFAKYSNPSRQICSTNEDLFEKGGGEALEGKNPLHGIAPPNDFVMYTEFVNVDGLTHPEGYKKLSLDLKFTENQRPIVAQIWGTNPEKFYEASKIVANMGFDGIDINMGCPQDKEIGLGACAALIRNPMLAKEIIQAVKKGAGGLPVSVKTRIGYTKPEEMESWIVNLLECNVATIALHGRTKQEKSKVPAHWDVIAMAVKVRDGYYQNKEMGLKTLIIGNGDIKSYEEGLQRLKESGCDGVMVGRGAFGSPWFFRNDSYVHTAKERMEIMLEHSEYFENEFSGIKNFQVMRKHFKAYASGFAGSHELRAKLMGVKNLEETKKIVQEFLANNT